MDKIKSTVILTILNLIVFANASEYFKWGLLKHNDKDSSVTTIRLQDKNIISKDENLKFIFVSDKPVFIYILYTDQTGYTKLLSDIEEKENAPFFYPTAKDWISFDTTGEESFDLIVLNEKNKKLDKLIKDYEKQTNKTPQSTDIITKQKFLIYNELKKLSHKYSYLKDTAEKPVSISGSVKGECEKYNLTQIINPQFYHRKIIIEYRE